MSDDIIDFKSKREPQMVYSGPSLTPLHFVIKILEEWAIDLAGNEELLNDTRGLASKARRIKEKHEAK